MKEFKRMIYRKNQTPITPIINSFCIVSITYNNTNSFATASIVITYLDSTPDSEYYFTAGETKPIFTFIDTNVSDITLQWNDNSLTMIEPEIDLYPFLNSTVNFQKTLDESFDFALSENCVS